MEPNKTYVGGGYNGTKRSQEMCLIMSADSEQYWGIWGDLKKINLLGMENFPKTPTAAYDVLWGTIIRNHDAKNMYHPGQ